MRNFKFATIMGVPTFFVLVVILLFAFPTTSICPVNAQEGDCGNLAVTLDVLQTENFALRATIDALDAELNSINSCQYCLGAIQSFLTTGSATPNPEFTDSPEITPSVSSGFRDDFSQSSPLWDLSTVGQIVDGELIVTTERDNDFVIIPFIADTPVRLTVRARLDADTIIEDITYVTLMYGDIDRNSYILVKISPTYIEISESTDGHNKFLASFITSESVPDWTTHQSISVTFGETLSVYLNDVFLGNSLSVITGTQFALGIEYNGVTGTESVYFDSVEIDLIEQ